MNKAIQKMMMALAVCGALCGTAMAAPKGNPPSKDKAPTAMNAPAQKPHAFRIPTPAKHTAKAPAKMSAKAHHTPTHAAPRYDVARHTPPSPPHVKRHKPPKHHHDNRHHDCRHSGTLHTDDWCEIGASLLGGLVGGLIGASI